MRALIGHTGFVGGSLARRFPYERYYNSKNIDAIDQGITQVAIAGMPGLKWRANAEPEADRATLDRLIRNLDKLPRSCEALLISTVDVYDPPVGRSVTDIPDATKPYGLHRRLLEGFVIEHFSSVRILRLPNLFGVGLKKNALYDLIQADKMRGMTVRMPADDIHHGDTYQWWDVDEIPGAFGPTGIYHLVSEPISMDDIAWAAFGRRLSDQVRREPIRYDIRHTLPFAIGLAALQKPVLPRIVKFVHESRRL